MKNTDVIVKRGIYHLGKIDYNGTGRKVNAVDVEWELRRNTEGQYLFSAQGSIWNHPHTDIFAGGQILDEFLKYSPLSLNARLKRIIKIWKRWHLNDMHSECGHQRARGETWNTHTSIVCPECGWKLGHGWCVDPMTDDAVNEVLSWPEGHDSPVGRIMDRIPVIFRRWRDSGEIIALFPTLLWNEFSDDVTSYMHVGQHGGANYASVISRSTPVNALDRDVINLLYELAEQGYDNLVARQRRR